MRLEVPYGTLDLLVLRTLEALGPQHGFGIARRIEQVSENVLHLNQGSIYPALLRLEQRGFVSTSWGTSENGRQAKFYAITDVGRAAFQEEIANWEQMTSMVSRILRGEM